jgi:hypothetical protein
MDFGFLRYEIIKYVKKLKRVSVFYSAILPINCHKEKNRKAFTG